MEKCKVKNCQNSEWYNSRAGCYGIYGYCQIHTLERLRLADQETEDKIKKEISKWKIE